MGHSSQLTHIHSSEFHRHYTHLCVSNGDTAVLHKAIVIVGLLAAPLVGECGTDGTQLSAYTHTLQ